MLQLVETCSQLAGACLEQTTWLRRNLAVREDASPEPQPTTPSPTSSMTRVDTLVGESCTYPHPCEHTHVIVETTIQ
jgi:hypothetical protein